MSDDAIGVIALCSLFAVVAICWAVVEWSHAKYRGRKK